MTAHKKTMMKDAVLIEYKDVITAFDGIKAAVFKGKGECTARIAALVYGELENKGVATHFMKMEGANTLVCKPTSALPLQMIVRNRICGTTARLLGLEDGSTVANTIYELRYKDENLGNPMINEDHAVALGIADYGTLAEIKSLVLRCNEVLCDYFSRAGIELVDFKMEVGRDNDGKLLLTDDVTPDNSRLWDKASGKRLDKDRFRHDLSDVFTSYRDVLERLK